MYSGEKHRPTDTFVNHKSTGVEELQSLLEQCELQVFHDKNVRFTFQHALEIMYYSDEIKVGTARFPQSMVRSRMHSLHGSILTYALSKMKTHTQNISEIRNSTKYIVSTIWNSISEYHSDVELDPGLNQYLNTT